MAINFRLLLLSLFAICVSCTTTEAPVVDGWRQKTAEPSDYRVQKGDSIYAVAWAFGMDYRQLVQLNHLSEPYELHAGQVLRMPTTTSSSTITTKQHAKAAPAPQFQVVAVARSPYKIKKAGNAPVVAATAVSAPAPASTAVKPASVKITGHWLWPTQGKVVQGYAPTTGNKGIDITGHPGQPVVATAMGKVVYTGASMPGYGNLIIIKHTDNELSAYAFNQVIAVKEGQVVQAGQRIASMGKNDVGKPMLHFEIRQGGKPVDPVQYLMVSK